MRLAILDHLFRFAVHRSTCNSQEIYVKIAYACFHCASAFRLPLPPHNRSVEIPIMAATVQSIPPFLIQECAISLIYMGRGRDHVIRETYDG